MLEEATVYCPYCGEPFTALVDCSAGSQQYTEDCVVCCQPIVLAVTVTDDAALQAIEAWPENA